MQFFRAVGSDYGSRPPVCVLADHGPRTTDHGPRTTDHGPRTTDHGPRTTDHGPRSMEPSATFATAGPNMEIPSPARAIGDGRDTLDGRFTTGTTQGHGG